MSLTKAIEAGNIKFLEQLIHDNDVGILIEPDVYGQYPLHYASVHGKLDIVTLLVEEAGADVNCRTHTGTTPAHYAARSNRVAILKYLMSKGADITARDAHSWTPLHYAALAGYADTVEIIINENNNSPDGKPKMDIDMQELHGYTPLHLACFNGFTDVAVALIDAGADFSKLGGGKERTKAEYPLRMLPLKAKDPLSLDDSLLRLQKAVHSSCNKLHKNFFTYLYEQKNFCDFELTFGEESIQTHKAVLFSRVGFFRDFDFDKSGGKYAVPDKFTKEAFEYFLEWCYTGSIHSLVDEERETEITTAHIPIIVNLIDIAEFYCGEEADCSGLPELCISGLSRGLTAEIVDTLIHALISAKETSEWIDKLCIVAVEGLLSLKDTTFNKKAYEEIAKFSKRRIKVIVKGLKPLLTNKPPELSSLRFENIVAPPPPPPLFDELLGDDDANSGNNVNTPQEKADDPLVAEEREKKLHQSKSLVPNVFVLEMSSACPQKLKKYMRDTNEMESFQKVLPFLLSTRNSKVCLGMIEKMRSAPDSSWFINPVPDNQDYAPGYYKVIKHPMDLTTLKEMILGKEILTVGEFITLARQIWQNCFTYNQKGQLLTIGRNIAQLLETLIRAECKKGGWTDDYDESIFVETAQVAFKTKLESLTEETLIEILDESNISLDESNSLDIVSSFSELRKAFHDYPRRLLEFKKTTTPPSSKKQRRK